MKCQKGDVCMADDLVILAQFVKTGKITKKSIHGIGTKRNFSNM